LLFLLVWSFDVKNILVTGAVLRKNGFELGEGKYYGGARLLRLNVENGGFEKLLSIDKVHCNYPSETPNIQFTAGCIDADVLWLPTDTEIRKYSYPCLELLSVFSHTCFNNIHSVTVRGQFLYVTSTGIDMVVVLDKNTGVIVTKYNAEGKGVWHRFSKSVDYRQMYSTRPHDCHPNYIFWIKDEPWVTRCTQEDAVSLFDVSKRIDISGPNKEISVHDGLVVNNDIYFTSVDGCIIKADIETYLVKDIIYLNKMKGFNWVRGWSRGILIDNNVIYVAFSKLRKTKNLKKLEWLGKFTQKFQILEQCSILAIDLTTKTIVNDYIVPEGMIDAIYSILPEPDA